MWRRKLASCKSVLTNEQNIPRQFSRPCVAAFCYTFNWPPFARSCHALHFVRARVALQCTTRSRPPTHSFLCCDTGIPCGGALQIRTFPSAICTPRRVLAPGQTGQASWYKSALCRRLRRDIHCTRHGQTGTGKRPDLEVLAGFLGHLHMCPSLDES